MEHMSMHVHNLLKRWISPRCFQIHYSQSKLISFMWYWSHSVIDIATHSIIIFPISCSQNISFFPSFASSIYYIIICAPIHDSIEKSLHQGDNKFTYKWEWWEFIEWKTFSLLLTFHLVYTSLRSSCVKKNLSS